MQILANVVQAANTGDNSNVALYVILLVVAVILVVFLTFKDKFIKPKDGNEKDAADKKDDQDTVKKADSSEEDK